MSYRAQLEEELLLEQARVWRVAEAEMAQAPNRWLRRVREAQEERESR